MDVCQRSPISSSSAKRDQPTKRKTLELVINKQKKSKPKTVEENNIIFIWYLSPLIYFVFLFTFFTLLFALIIFLSFPVSLVNMIMFCTLKKTEPKVKPHPHFHGIMFERFNPFDEFGIDWLIHPLLNNCPKKNTAPLIILYYCYLWRLTTFQSSSPVSGKNEPFV